MNVSIADALVQQLPHCPLESRADLLRLVRHMETGHSQLISKSKENNNNEDKYDWAMTLGGRGGGGSRQEHCHHLKSAYSNDYQS